MADDLTLNQRIDFALANHDRISGVHQSLDDVITPQSDVSFMAHNQEAKNLLGQLWQVAEALLRLNPDGTQASPLESALLESMGPAASKSDLDRTGASIEAIRLLSKLPLGAYAEANALSKRGRRPSRSAAVRAVVRSVVHHLYLEGKPYRGGWSYLDRSGRPGRRTTERELAAIGAALTILESLRHANLVAERAEVRGHHLEYITELGSRPPSDADYVTDYSAFASTD